eukprot:m.357785 g.357785  ORF g.357785 m.357785 type:complete len:400 (-) comp17939_c0_seq1:1396-2595(-)
MRKPRQFSSGSEDSGEEFEADQALYSAAEPERFSRVQARAYRYTRHTPRAHGSQISDRGRVRPHHRRPPTTEASAVRRYAAERFDDRMTPMQHDYQSRGARAYAYADVHTTCHDGTGLECPHQGVRHDPDSPPSTHHHQSRNRGGHDGPSDSVDRDDRDIDESPAAPYHPDPHREWQTDQDFEEGLRRTHGWQIVPMEGDGACLFRAIAYHVFGDQEYHGDVRAACIEYMRANRAHFAPFVSTDFDEYLRIKSLPSTHGNHLEIEAMSEMYGRKIEIYAYNRVPINTFQGHRSSQAPIRISYHNNNHYNAILDPTQTTFGVGLGLTDHTTQPQSVEQDIVQQVQAETANADVEQDMFAQMALLDSLQHALSQSRAQDQSHPPLLSDPSVAIITMPALPP